MTEQDYQDEIQRLQDQLHRARKETELAQTTLRHQLSRDLTPLLGDAIDNPTSDHPTLRRLHKIVKVLQRHGFTL